MNWPKKMNFPFVVPWKWYNLNPAPQKTKLVI